MSTHLSPARVSAFLIAIASLTSGSKADEGPLARWKLAADARNSVSLFGDNPARLDGTAVQIRFTPADGKQSPAAAAFDGRESAITVPDNEALQLGTSDFSVSAWVHLDPNDDDVPGDVLAKFDHATRTGFHLGIVTNAASPSSLANHRMLTFGIDAGRLGEWVDHGRPGNAVLIYALAVHDGHLYAGICEAGPHESGHVYRYAGGNQWIDCGSPAPCNAVSALAVFDGKLYAAVSHYRLRGSALADSENETFGGRVYRYQREQRWVDTGPLADPDPEAINGLLVYRGNLYASLTYAPGLFRYDRDTGWTSCGSPDGKRVEALGIYNGFLYATGYDEGAVYRYDGETWTHLGRLADNTQTYSFAVLRGDLYVGTWPSGRVYRLHSQSDWVETGRLGEELEVMGMANYNGSLYAGTLPLAEVYRYDADQAWTNIGRVDFTPDVKYRRAWSMAVFDGRLFVGTLPSGHVWSIEAGKCATSGRPLLPGWHHVAGVKRGGKLSLYCDGTLEAESSAFDPADYNLSNNAPLTIGFGPHDHFDGHIRDVRLYRRALNPEEIRQIAAQ